jgi:hypothetical protein
MVWLEIVYVDEYYADDYILGPRWNPINCYQLDKE